MKINDKTRESIFPTYVYHFDIEDYDDVLFKVTVVVEPLELTPGSDIIVAFDASLPA